MPLDLPLLLDEMIQRGASDLHVSPGERPRLRVDGSLQDSGVDWVPTAAETLALAFSILSEAQKRRFEDESEIDLSFEIPGRSRFRVNAYRQRGCAALAIRRIPIAIVSLEELCVPAILGRLADLPRGLVLVTGPTGSGKSTTLAAMIDRINRGRRGHILTIEDPIEFVHSHQGCLVTQREIGTDTGSFARALKSALRQDPDVILLGEMRDLETVQAALTLAETGHLCLATLHTRSAAESVNRIIDVFPTDRQAQVRGQLSLVLEGVVTQTLLPRARSAGRVLAAEVMVCTPAVRACIRDGKVHQIHSILQTSRKHGMQTLNDSLAQLYLRSEAALDACVSVSPDPAEFLRMVGEPPEG